VSIGAVIDHLDWVDPVATKEARKRYGCLEERWVEDPAAYGLVALRGMEDCERHVMERSRDLLNK
jgi:hypothetical protein